MRKFFVIGYNILVVLTMISLFLDDSVSSSNRMVFVLILLGLQTVVNIVDDIADEVL